MKRQNYFLIGTLLMIAAFYGCGPVNPDTGSSFTLTVTKAGAGSGTATSTPVGINCGSDCSEVYTVGTVVTLMAIPDIGSVFAGFSGNADCADGSVTMNANINCTATFNLISASLSGKLWILLKSHADGLQDLQDLEGWKTLAKGKAAELQNKGIPWTLELTKEHVNKINDPIWFQSMAALGTKFAPREPHNNLLSSAEDAHNALVSMGIVPQEYVGSFSNIAQYADRQWPLFTGGATPGHTNDPDWSGFDDSGYLDNQGRKIIVIGIGTANSVAIKVGIARDIAKKQRDWAVEVLTFTAVGLKGATAHFVTPSTHGTNPPKAILSEIDLMLSSIGQEGNLGVVEWSDPKTVTEKALNNNQIIDYVIPKS